MKFLQKRLLLVALSIVPFGATAQCFQNLIYSNDFVGSYPSVGELHTVYDAADHCTVLITGGGVYNPAPGFWVYNGSQWNGPYVGTGDMPHARDSFGVCYDSQHGQILLFGGTVNIPDGASMVTNDLYAFRGANKGEGATWVRLSAGGANGPPVTRDHTYYFSRTGQPAAFDPIRDRAIFVLPKGDDGYTYQTWEWTGTGWDQGPDFGPAYPDQFQQFIFDPYRNEGILIEADPDTVWRYKPGVTAAQGTWTLLTSRPGTIDGPFYGRALVYDPFRHWVLQCFGRDRDFATGKFLLSETRVWNPDSLTWSLWPERSFPASWAQARPLAVWDTDRDTMVVTLGYDDSNGDPGRRYFYNTIEQTHLSAGVVSSSSGSFAKCVGDSITFSVTASGDSPLFQWYKNGAPLSGKTVSVLILSNLTTDDAGNYYAVVTNDCGYTPSPVSHLRVDEPITIIRPSIFPDCSQICPGGSYTITPPLPHSTGDAPLSIHLQKNFGSAEFPAWADVRVSTPSAPANFVFDDVERSFTGDYRFYVDGSACGGIVEGSPRHIEVGFDIVGEPQSLSNIRPCSTVTFSVSTSGGCGLSYYWRKQTPTSSELLFDDGHFIGTRSPTLTIAGVHYNDQAGYDCAVIDTNQCGNAIVSTEATLTLAAPQWVLRTTNGPSPRYANAMAYDSARKVTVMYSGGYLDPAAGYRGFGDVWEWNGALWSQRTTFVNSDAWHQDINGYWVQNYGDTPAARMQHAMAYDNQRGRTVLFGGRGGPNGIFGDFVFNDTWEWDGTRWYFRTTNGPPATFNHHMTYDPVRGVTVLYGGAFSSAAKVWEWDGTNWTSISPTNGPVSNYYQENVCLDFDTVLGAVFGGWTGDGFWARYYWTWDGRDWRPRASGFYFGNYSPSFGAMVYDTYRYRSFHYGGQDTVIGYTGSSTSAYYDSSSDAWTLLADAAQRSAFSASDFVNVLALAGKLTGQTDPVSQYLWNQFDTSTLQVLTNTSSTADQLASALVTALNTIIANKTVFDTNRFAAVTLSEETQVFKAVNPQFKDFVRFNRLLLEDAYPAEIGRSPSTPTGRYYLGMAFDSARRAATVMGGYYGGAGLNPLNGSDTWELMYLDSPLINEQPASQYRAPGDTAVFTVNAVAPYGSTLSYDWYYGNTTLSNGGRISGAHSATLQIANVSAADEGQYHARISAPCGTISTVPAILTTNAKLQIFGLSQNSGQLLWSVSGLVLQQADSLAGPWITVAGAASPYNLIFEGPTRFFRLNGN